MISTAFLYASLNPHDKYIWEWRMVRLIFDRRVPPSPLPPGNGCLRIAKLTLNAKGPEGGEAGFYPRAATVVDTQKTNKSQNRNRESNQRCQVKRHQQRIRLNITIFFRRSIKMGLSTHLQKQFIRVTHKLSYNSQHRSSLIRTNVTDLKHTKIPTNRK
jgi:hypothetical protein